MPRFKTTSEAITIAKDKDHIRDAGIIAHVDHGKTTLTDSLLAAAGMLSPSMAGTALALDYLEEEQQRQMTIKAANISLFYERDVGNYLINLIDTPGHVDFSGRVTRALRAIDGAVVVVDAVEEVMVQTETVTRQALEERVRPVLYVNKIDRLIKELRLSADKIQEKLGRIIQDFNRLIDMYGEPQFKNRWKVSPLSGTVAFGSAKDRWGLTLQIAQDEGITFSNIVDAYQTNHVEDLAKEAPLHTSILDMITEHMPAPHIAQKYRVPTIWRGDPNSPIGKAMVECDPNGPAVMSVININVDPQAGVVATGRLFSGTLSEGDTVNLINAKSSSRIQQVCLYMGPYREVVGNLPAGNIPALLGLSKARSGETIATISTTAPFEAVRYVTEPVVTMAIEPKYSRELPKLISFLRKLSIEDPTLVTKINEETGEYLISGMGQLHLEIAKTWIDKADIETVTSNPIVIYREGIRSSAGPFESRSPNRHNRLLIAVEPLAPELVEMVIKGKIWDGMDRAELARTLRSIGWPSNEARGVWQIDERGNIFTDITRGIQRLDQIKGSITIGFVDAMVAGPLAGEPVRGVKVKLEDASVHEDPVHFGPGQIIPATRAGIFAAGLSANPVLLEPLLKINIKLPVEQVGAVTSIIAQKRGRVLSIDQRDYLTYITGELPTSEAFDLSEVIRGATGGRAFWGTEFSRWDAVPASLLHETVREVRKRKGLSPEPPKPQALLR
ncbi:MAG: elongation factor EF-2 [Candidatus Bathyarchaeota archaeon]|nr:MAG: elongation factor EF-2 [Candidatus Bathyarchaeota archaeon]